LNGQFIETRMNTGSRGCQGGLINKVIHRHCGYLKNVLIIHHLAQTLQGAGKMLARASKGFREARADLANPATSAIVAVSSP
jgi:hypothetical protein